MTELELYHHGIKGQKWGRRRFQNPDGSLKPAGKKRYYDADGNLNEKGIEKYARKGYAEDSKRKSHGLSKVFDTVTDGHSNYAAAMYGASSKAENKKKAEQYLKNKAKQDQKKENFRERRAEISSSRQLGHKLATNILAGPFANRTYNSVLAAGGTRAGAMAVTVVSNALGGPMGHLAVSALYTNAASKGKTAKS